MFTSDPDLATALSFTAEDLAANRLGQFTARQTVLLRKKRKDQFSQYLLNGMGFGSFSILFIAVLLFGKIAPGQEIVALIAGAFGTLTLVLIAAAGWAIFTFRPQLDADLAADKVQAIIGKAAFTTRKTWRELISVKRFLVTHEPEFDLRSATPRYFITINATIFELSGRAFWVMKSRTAPRYFVDDQDKLKTKSLNVFTLYYLPHTRIVLSAEYVGEST